MDMTKIKNNSNNARSRRNKTQKRVEALRHRTKIQNNKLSITTCCRKWTPVSKPSSIQEPTSLEMQNKLCMVLPEIKQVYKDGIFSFSPSVDGKEVLMFNSKSEFICALPVAYMMSFMREMEISCVS